MPPKQPTPGWLSADQLRASASSSSSNTAAAQAPGAKMTGRQAFHQAKQTNLLAFYPKEQAGGRSSASGGRSSTGGGGGGGPSGKGKGRERSASSSEDERRVAGGGGCKKARASEPLPAASRKGASRWPSSSSSPPPPPTGTTTVASTSTSTASRAPPPKRPRLSAPPATSSRSTAPPSVTSSHAPPRRKARTTETLPPPAAARVKREPLNAAAAAVDDDERHRSTPLPPTATGEQHPRYPSVKVEPREDAFARAAAGPGPSTSSRRVVVKPEPASLGPPGATDFDDDEEDDEEDADDNDAPAGEASYHKPTSLLSASLAPFLPASFPSPKRLPQHVLADLSTIGRPFAGPAGRERFLRRPRMPWETAAAWDGRQRELREWEAEEAARKERERRPLEPPARGSRSDGRPQGAVAQGDGHPAAPPEEEDDDDEPDTYFLGGPKKIRWPTPPMPPPRAPPPKAGPPPAAAAAPSPEPPSPGKEASLTSDQQSYTMPSTLPPPPVVAAAPTAPVSPESKASLACDEVEPEEESHTMSCTWPPDRKAVARPPADDDEPYGGAIEDEVSQAVGSARRPPNNGLPSRGASPSLTAPAHLRPHPPTAAPRRLTDKEETSVILSLDARPTASPERPAPPLPTAGVDGAQDDVIPSSQTDEGGSSSFLAQRPTAPPPSAPRSPSLPKARILVLASQESVAPSPPSSSSGTTTPRRLGLSASQPSPSSAGGAESSRTSRKLALSSSQPAPAQRDGTVTPSRRVAVGRSQSDASAERKTPPVTTPAQRRLRADPSGSSSVVGDDDVVPTSEARERTENQLAFARTTAADDERVASPTPTRQRAAPEAHVAVAPSTERPSRADKGKGRAKPRASWPVWTGAGLVDLDESLSDAGLLEGARSSGSTSAVGAVPEKPLLQDSLLQHGFGRSVTRAPRPPTPDAPVLADEALTDDDEDDDETGPPPLDFPESIVPSSQSLAPLGWGAKLFGQRPDGGAGPAGAAGRKVGRVPSPPPRTVLARPPRRKPPPPPGPSTGKAARGGAPDVVDLAGIPDSQPHGSPSPAKIASSSRSGTDPDITLVNLSQRSMRSSSPSTSEDDDDEVDADVTLLAPPPPPTMHGPMLSQGVVPDSQPTRSQTSTSRHPSPLQPELTPEELYDFLKSSSHHSSEVDLGSL